MGEVPRAGQFLSPVVVAFPLMTREKAAEHMGLSVGVLQGWIDKGLVRTHGIGKRRLVDVMHLVEQVLERRLK